MKSVFVPFAAVVLLAAAAGGAEAAAPTYCALYAREYANQFTAAAGEKPGSEPKIQDEAYYRCLNMDQDPQMPATSAYSGTSLDPSAQGGPLEPVPAGQTVATQETAAAIATTAVPAATASPAPPATSAAPPAVAPAMKTADSGSATDGGSTKGRSYIPKGIDPWTPKWQAACKKYFPNSFNEKDGTIVPHGSPKRVFCQ